MCIRDRYRDVHFLKQAFGECKGTHLDVYKRQAYGDVLLKVDGYDGSGADIDDLAVLVRGEAGTVVELAAHQHGQIINVGPGDVVTVQLQEHVAVGYAVSRRRAGGIRCV